MADDVTTRGERFDAAFKRFESCKHDDDNAETDPDEFLATCAEGSCPNCRLALVRHDDHGDCPCCGAGLLITPTAFHFILHLDAEAD